MASQKIVVYQKCAQCGGTGIQPGGGAPGQPGPFTCTWPGCSDPSLGEIGEYPIGHIYLEPSLEDLQDRHDETHAKLNVLVEESDDIRDKVDDIKEKVDEIKEAVDAL